jgi:hypothetical protein
MSPATIKRTYVFMYSTGYCNETKEYSLAYGLLWTYNLAKQIVTTDKSLRSFSASASVGIEYFTRSHGINQLRSNKY